MLDVPALLIEGAEMFHSHTSHVHLDVDPFFGVGYLETGNTEFRAITLIVTHKSPPF
jgi:hypothetical protein